MKFTRENIYGEKEPLNDSFSGLCGKTVPQPNGKNNTGKLHLKQNCPLKHRDTEATMMGPLCLQCENC